MLCRPAAPVNDTLVGVIFAVPTTVPLLAACATLFTTGLGVATSFSTAAAVAVAVPKFKFVVQLGYATGKLVAVGIVYVGLTKVGT